MLALPTDANLHYVVGDSAGFSAQPLAPFDPTVCVFLTQLSEQLMADAVTRSMPDVMSFAWWCRKANIAQQVKQYDDAALRIGRGLAFHVPPANVPVNFAFSWVFSLLAGNSNVVRLPSREFPQIDFLVQHIQTLLSQEVFHSIARRTAFVRYGHEEHITAAFSGLADARILWGGDATIQTFRRFAQPPRSIDVCFANRYSFSIFGAAAILALEPEPLNRLAARFFNDAYIMDQNACSSPRMVIWYGSPSAAEQAGQRFWAALRTVVESRYELEAISSMDKFMQACRDAIELDELAALQRTDNRIYRIHLKTLPTQIAQRQCGSGYFYEYSTEQLDELAPVVTGAYQTLTYFGISREELSAFVLRNRLPGIDRIVPVGEALDIGLIWDGYDLIRTLSRICEVR